MSEPEKTENTTKDGWPPEGRKPDAPTASAADEMEISPQPDVAPSEHTTTDLLCDILTSVYRAEGMTAQGFTALRERLDAIEARLNAAGEPPNEQLYSPASDVDESSSGLATDSDTPTPLIQAEAVCEVDEDAPPSKSAAASPSTVQVADTKESLPPMAQPVTPAPQAIPQPTQPVRDVHPVAHGGGELEAIIFGDDFPFDQRLASQRQALLAAVRQRQEDALGLIGQLLIVRAATMDRLPTLMKDVGEAWYRWQLTQHDADDMRDALIAWLHGRLEAVGLGNRIELVRVGDRYDSKRHNAKARGVEVTGVHGWVVLRDNGNVYTKANVTVA